MQLLVIVLISVSVVLVAGYAMRLYRIEKLEPEEESPKQGAGQAPPAAEPGSQEPVDLTGYFSGSGESAPEEPVQAPVPAAQPVPGPPAPQIQGAPPAAQEAPAVADTAAMLEETDSSIAFDKLSELKKGRTYIRDCQNVLDQARENNQNYVALYFDIDRFRFINDLKGYSIGDYVLSRLAQSIQTIFPHDAECARMSADHFTCLFRLDNESQVEEYAEQIRKACDKIRGDMGIKGSIRICMGIAATQNVADYDAGVLMQKANIARHCLKVAKSEMFALFDESMVTTYLYGESAVEDFAEKQYADELAIYYQPQCDIARARLVGSEALVRWTCDDDPEKPATPSDGRIPTNNAKVVYHVCRAISRWRKANKEILPVCVNLSVTDFYKKDIDGFLEKCMTEYQVEPRQLCAVVDRSVILVDWTIANHQLRRIKELGVGVGIDGIDVGTTDLAFLEGLPVDIIKVHKSFARAAQSPDAANHQVVGNILAAGTQYGVKVIFEGINELEQMRALEALGATLMQGLYAGKTLDADGFLRELPEQSFTETSGDTVIATEADFVSGNYR